MLLTLLIGNDQFTFSFYARLLRQLGLFCRVDEFSFYVCLGTLISCNKRVDGFAVLIILGCVYRNLYRRFHLFQHIETTLCQRVARTLGNIFGVVVLTG